MKLIDFKDEIFAISKANGNVDIGIATDMFLNNIKDATNEEDQYHYAGADHVDYVKLMPHHKELSEDKANFYAEIKV